MNVIGLGKPGCAIAKKLSVYPQYTVYYIDSGCEEENGFNFPHFEHPEEYEANVPDLKDFFSEIEGDVTLILSGASNIAGASLRILHQLEGCKITILYIRPNMTQIEDVKLKMHRACFGVMQEYARSAIFERIILLDNEMIEDILGDIPIIGYFDKINDFIVWNYHMINVLQKSDPVMGKIGKPKETCRITTLGTVDFETVEEKSFFNLDTMREKNYFYLLRESDLLSSGKLLKTINGQVSSLEMENCKSSYAIYSSSYEDNYVLTLFHTPNIQKEEK
jgi:hypothetical protein